MLMYSSHEQNTLSVVNGMSQQQEPEDNAMALTNDATNLLSMFGDAALFIPETGEVAAALQDDEQMCQLKVQHEILRYHMTRMHLEGKLSQVINVLKQWWQENEKHFPILWQLAQIYLAIPATSAISECAFSAAGNIVTAKRNQLNPDLVQACHLIQDNAWALQETRPHIFLLTNNTKPLDNDNEKEYKQH